MIMTAIMEMEIYKIKIIRLPRKGEDQGTDGLCTSQNICKKTETQYRDCRLGTTIGCVLRRETREGNSRQGDTPPASPSVSLARE